MENQFPSNGVAKAARKHKILHDEQTKRRIWASQLLNRLESFAKGEIEMTSAQVLADNVVIGKSSSGWHQVRKRRTAALIGMLSLGFAP